VIRWPRPRWPERPRPGRKAAAGIDAAIALPCTPTDVFAATTPGKDSIVTGNEPKTLNVFDLRQVISLPREIGRTLRFNFRLRFPRRPGGRLFAVGRFGKEQGEPQGTR
jgi:hypothetical protein